MPKPPSSRDGERSEAWAETTRPRLAWSRTGRRVNCSDWQDVAVRGSHTERRPLPALNRVDALTAGSEQGLESVSGLESFPLCYTAGRHEGARREARVELMTEPADRAVLLLQKVSELLLESRAIVKELEAVPDGQSSADAADRIA